MPHTTKLHTTNTWTIIIDFGPEIPSPQLHLADEVKAKRTALALKDKMLAATSAYSSRRCIEGVQLWKANTLVATYTPAPPISLPEPDASGVIRLPERISGKRPAGLLPAGGTRLPSTKPTKSSLIGIL